MAENYEIFSGMRSASPNEIRDALGGLEGDDVVPNLIGAVMTLCHYVGELESRLAGQAAAPGRGRRRVKGSRA